MIYFYCHAIFGKPCFTDVEGTRNIKKYQKTKQKQKKQTRKLL